MTMAWDKKKLHEEYTATHDFFNLIIITQLYRMQFLCVYVGPLDVQHSISLKILWPSMCCFPLDYCDVAQQYVSIVVFCKRMNIQSRTSSGHIRFQVWPAPQAAVWLWFVISSRYKNDIDGKLRQEITWRIQCQPWFQQSYQHQLHCMLFNGFFVYMLVD